jgi:hypothetical protein
MKPVPGRIAAEAAEEAAEAADVVVMAAAEAEAAAGNCRDQVFNS